MNDAASKTARWSPRALLERLGVIVLGLLLWEAAVRGFEVSPLLVPSPVAVFDQLVRGVMTGVLVRTPDGWLFDRLQNTDMAESR